LLYSSEFNEERLKVTVAKLQQNIPETKRDGNNVVSSVSGGLLKTKQSTLQAAGIMTQMTFIPQLAKALEENPAEIKQDFEELRKAIINPKGIRFSVRGNILSIPQPQTAWERNFARLPKTELAPVPWTYEVLSELGKKPAKKAVVVSLPTIESSFAIHTTSISGSEFKGFKHPDYAALKVACEVLEGTESFLWRYIRGAGLAYGADMSLDLESGLLSFSLYRSPDSYKAFEQGKKVVESLVDGSIELKETDLDTAKSSLVYAFTRQVSNPPRAAQMSFINQVLKDIPMDHGRRLLEKMQAVTIDEVKRMLKQYVAPLFDPFSSVAVVVSAPGKCDSISEGLQSVGFEVERRTLELTPEDEAGMERGEGESGGESDREAGLQR
jgi:Zn-dependent M16 (insulinase) family peptidase